MAFKEELADYYGNCFLSLEAYGLIQTQQILKKVGMLKKVEDDKLFTGGVEK